VASSSPFRSSFIDKVSRVPRALVLTGSPLSRIVSFRIRMQDSLQEILDRGMRFSFTRYAYRYRYSFTGERAGETCAGEVSKTS
jgi:hypothetical protein